MHGTILKSLQKQAKHIHAWWDFTGRPDPGEDGVVESLKRLVSGVLTHPITIGKWSGNIDASYLFWYTYLTKGST